jgi:23S rRNA pseudouridine2605 synthase
MKIEPYLSSQTNLSRRKITELINQGQISINGKVITSYTENVRPGNDIIKITEKIIEYKTPLLYYKFNKPKNVICSLQDPKDRNDLKPYLKHLPVSLFPIGRLDRNTKGLLLFTNDGNFAQKILHPKYKIHKTYRIILDKPLTKNHLNRILQGIILEDGPVEFSNLIFISKKEFILSIQEGRNRIVRRTFEHLGYQIITLKRIAIGTLQLGKLQEGKFQKLTSRQINSALSINLSDLNL